MQVFPPAVSRTLFLNDAGWQHSGTTEQRKGSAENVVMIAINYLEKSLFGAAQTNSAVVNTLF